MVVVSLIRFKGSSSLDGRVTVRPGSRRDARDKTMIFVVPYMHQDPCEIRRERYS